MSVYPVKVAVRMRPPLEEEVVVSSELLQLNTFQGNVVVKRYINNFDAVYDQYSTNKVIYKDFVEPNIKNLLNGYNVTILAYGSTGSGKTHTMGTCVKNAEDSDPGLIPLGLDYIFEVIKTLVSKSDVTLTASFLEIYLEEITDLLNTSNTNLLVRGDSQDLKIINLTEITINSANEALHLLEKGSNARHTDTTAKNISSSRSHAIFTVNISIVDKSTGHSRKSKFQLVDLAGSERTKTSKTEGQQFKQGLAINKALSTLGRVINSIYKGEKHIPFRDSILTRILQDSFGGNSYTVMIACISPSSSSFEETQSTLRYASQAKHIENTPVINKDAKEALIEKLQSQLKAYEEELKKYHNGKMIVGSNVCAEDGVLKSSEKEMIEPSIVQKKLCSIGTIKTYINDLFASDKFQLENEKKEIILKELKIMFDEFTNVSDVNTTQYVINPPAIQSSSKMHVDPTFSDTEVKEESEVVLLQIENLNKDLENKEKDLEKCKLFSEVLDVHHHKENINEIVNQKINELQMKRDSLVEEKKTENTNIIQKLEENIDFLEKQLKTKQTYEVYKHSNSKREEFLKNEIQLLKTSKVDLMKKLKEETRSNKRKVLEQARQNMALQKAMNLNEVKYKKKELSLQNKLRILERKVDDSQKKIAKSRSKVEDSKDIVKTTRAFLKQQLYYIKAISEVEETEIEIKTLKEQIINQDNAEEQNKHQETLRKLTNTVKSTKETLKNIVCGEEGFLKTITNIEDAKVAMKVLIEQIKSAEKEKCHIMNDWEKTKSTVDNFENSLELLHNKNIILTKEIEELKTKEMKKKDKQRKGSPNKDAEITSTITYLDESDESFLNMSDLKDPDYRATPLNKRKPKRKLKNTTFILEEEVKITKKFVHGCNCPSNCTSMRCSCRKKGHVCGQFCNCNKVTCLNVSSTSKKN